MPCLIFHSVRRSVDRACVVSRTGGHCIAPVYGSTLTCNVGVGVGVSDVGVGVGVDVGVGIGVGVGVGVDCGGGQSLTLSTVDTNQ